MYTIHADGKLLFDSLSDDVGSIVLSPKLLLDINKAGSLSLMLPPGNNLHGDLKKIKTLVTVEQDGELLARGRVTEIETDIYNQQSVYCEGEKTFLLDSVHAPYTYSGTVHGLFRKLLDNHNANVEDEKQFVIGEITAVSETETTAVECEVYSITTSELEERLLNAYGGYLRTRTVDGIHYIDWLEQYGDENSQPIEFSVNMLDLTDTADAADVFTVLIPLGASEINDDGEYTDPVTIASVNGGKNYIQDDDAVDLYGKIWRTETWNYITDAGKLLEKGREYLKTGIALETITLKAIDMHFVDDNVQPIRLGDRVRILSNPHGIDKVMVCSQIEIDLRNPENTVYTFGEKPRTLTDNVIRTKETLSGRGGGGGVKQEVGELLRWAELYADPELGRIQGIAWDVNNLTGRQSEVELYMDALEAVVKLRAERSIFNEVDDRMTSTEMLLNGYEGNIGLVAKVGNHEGWISSAEIVMNGMDSKITLMANEIELMGKVIADEIQVKLADIENIFAGYSEISSLGISGNLYAANANLTDTVRLLNRTCEWKSKTVQTSIPSFTTANITLANGNSVKVVTGWADAPSSYRSTMYYLSY